MDEQSLRRLLEAVQEGTTTAAEALSQLSSLPLDRNTFAHLDFQRTRRTGIAEVVFCQGKTPEQVIDILERLQRHDGKALATRASADVAQAVVRAFPDAYYSAQARIIMLGHRPAVADNQRPTAPYVAVVTAGTSDIPVAEEAALTLDYLGDTVYRVYDVGVAGIHRLFGRLSDLEQASAVIAVAGMEGALASVVGGLVACPLVAVPTSVGYGASFNGLAALLAMLNSCAPGAVVVNIDNGFGAAIHVHKILRSAKP